MMTTDKILFFASQPHGMMEPIDPALRRLCDRTLE